MSIGSISKLLWRSKVLPLIPLMSGLGLGPIVSVQPAQANSQSNSARRLQTESSRRTNYLDKNCKWHNYKQGRANYRICWMEDILMSVSMDGPEGDNGPTFYNLGSNKFLFRDTGEGTAVIIENDRLVAEVEVGGSSTSLVTTRFTAEQRKSRTDRALSAKKRLEAVGIDWQRRAR